ncbi:MAG: hypothetical protein WBW75_04865 [Mycobacterium sp.]
MTVRTEQRTAGATNAGRPRSLPAVAAGAAVALETGGDSAGH